MVLQMRSGGMAVFEQTIHNADHKRSHLFVRINCAAIPKDLLGNYSIILKSAQNQAQIKVIYQALAKTSYNKAKTVKLPGIHRTLLYKRMKEYNIGLKPE